MIISSEAVIYSVREQQRQDSKPGALTHYAAQPPWHGVVCMEVGRTKEPQSADIFKYFAETRGQATPSYVPTSIPTPSPSHNTGA